MNKLKFEVGVKGGKICCSDLVMIGFYFCFDWMIKLCEFCLVKFNLWELFLIF